MHHRVVDGQRLSKVTGPEILTRPVFQLPVGETRDVHREDRGQPCALDQLLGVDVQHVGQRQHRFQPREVLAALDGADRGARQLPGGLARLLRNLGLGQSERLAGRTEKVAYRGLRRFEHGRKSAAFPRSPRPGQFFGARRVSTGRRTLSWHDGRCRKTVPRTAYKTLTSPMPGCQRKPRVPRGGPEFTPDLGKRHPDRRS